jgi:copper chaperone CopZ
VATVTFEVDGMTCDGCETSVRNAVGQLPGVARVAASHSARQIVVTFVSEADEAAVREAVEDAGYDFVGRR